jgi:hypothetical protein
MKKSDLEIYKFKIEAKYGDALKTELINGGGITGKYQCLKVKKNNFIRCEIKDDGNNDFDITRANIIFLIRIIPFIGFFIWILTSGKARKFIDEIEDTWFFEIEGNSNKTQQLFVLKKLHDSGVLAKEEFDKEKNKILNQ